VWKIFAPKHLGAGFWFWVVDVGVLVGCKGDNDLVLGDQNIFNRQRWLRHRGHVYYTCTVTASIAVALTCLNTELGRSTFTSV
jgi:hypothetical protein